MGYRLLPIPPKALRGAVAAALGFLLAGPGLDAGNAAFAQDGPVPSADRRVQDGQDDLGLSSRGSGRLAEGPAGGSTRR